MIRNTVRALIFQDDKLLFIKKKRPNVGLYYALPGGAQEPEETLEQALNRECIEELGISLIDSKLLCIREYISKNHEYSFIMKEVHALDFIYICRINHIESEIMSIQADIGQIGIEWLPIKYIKQTLTQTDISLRTYKFPRTTHEFLKEYLLEQITEPYVSNIFES